MTPAHVVQITTPKKYLLNGLWFGPKKPKRVIIFIHGLTGSAFSMHGIATSLVTPSCSVLTFNNRGFGQINSVKRGRGKGASYMLAGTAHEVFTDCADDIQGAIDHAKRSGAKEIYLAGHSTGCQKAVYWASKKNDRRVKGLVLFGPLSDYSGALATSGKKRVEKGVAFARKLMRVGKPYELMPKRFIEWFECDAQRYVSLYTPDSAEELFTYARPAHEPRVLKKITLPALVFLAGADEYGDRAPGDIAVWFEKNLKSRHKVVIVPKVGHSFRGAEKRVAREVRQWIGAQK